VHEIKLRVWFVEAKKMYSWEELINNIGLSESVFIETDLWKPMQFTGLHDSKNVDIYEGDKVRRNTGYEFVVEKRLYSIGPSCRVWGYEIDKDDEVIGNIHETPADGRTN